jgi:hypothetical protein
MIKRKVLRCPKFNYNGQRMVWGEIRKVNQLTAIEKTNKKMVLHS